MRKITLILIICSFTQWVHGSSVKDISKQPFNDEKGNRVKMYYAFWLSQEVQEAHTYLPRLKQEGFDFFSSWKREKFASILQNLNCSKQRFEIFLKYPDLRYGDIRGAMINKISLPYSQENILLCKFLALQAKHLIENNCTPDEQEVLKNRLRKLTNDRFFDE